MPLVIFRVARLCTKKMYTLACQDMGIDCDFIAKGETVNEVIEKAKEHAGQEHSLDPENKEAIEKMMEDNVHKTGDGDEKQEEET